MRPPDTVLRARAVRRALDTLPQGDLAAFAPGLSLPMASTCLRHALAPLDEQALADAAQAEPHRARADSVGIVVAEGVFTAPIEWAALYAVAGCRVHLKAPAAEPALCLALADALAHRGLPVTASADRDLGGLEALVAFGGDGTGAALAQTWPDARLTAFGHRVSAALVDVPEDPIARARLATDLAQDVALYDSRGCMAPVAIFARGDAVALAGALHDALARVDARLPRGPLHPAQGPAWRQRVALARALGGADAALLADGPGGPTHAVLRLPASQCQPAALPRMAVLHPLADGPLDLAPLAALPLSSLAVQGADDLHAAADGLAPRVVAPGMLQRPAFPRLHDGVDMLGCVLRPG